MNHPRLLSRAIASAVIVTTLAHLFDREGGQFLAVPGMMIANSCEVAVMMLSDEDYYPLLSYAPLFNVVFYSASIYLVLWLYALIKRDKNLHHESLRQHTLRNPNG